MADDTAVSVAHCFSCLFYIYTYQCVYPATSLSLCPSICVSTQPPVCLFFSVHQFAYPATCLSLCARLSEYLPSHLSVSLSVHQFVYPATSLSLSLSLPVYQCVYPATCLSLFVYHFISFLSSQFSRLTLPRDWMPLDSTSSTTTQPTRLASTRCSCSSPGSAMLADLFNVRSLQCQCNAPERQSLPRTDYSGVGFASRDKHSDSFLHIMHKSIYLTPPTPPPTHQKTNKQTKHFHPLPCQIPRKPHPGIFSA